MQPSLSAPKIAKGVKIFALFWATDVFLAMSHQSVVIDT